MKQLGKLALVCARRSDAELHIGARRASVYIGQKEIMSAPWDDDEKINQMIRELNFGKYARESE